MSVTQEQKEIYKEWKSLVNMSKRELKRFYDSKEGKEAGLSKLEARKQGIDSGRESAMWIMRMKEKPYSKWSDTMWKWAKKQISFIKRMSGVKGDLYEEDGTTKTRKHTSLLIWGHNPKKKMEKGGELGKDYIVVSGVEFNIPYSELNSWMYDNDWTNEDLKDDPEYLINQFLDDEYGIEYNFENNYFEAYYLDDMSLRLIGNNKIALYHHTSSNLIDSIKENGLNPKHHQTNPLGNTYSGVYLTLDYSSKAVDGYKYHAVQKHGGTPITLKILVPAKELKNDPDDIDIESGKNQYIVDLVKPDQIIEIMEKGGEINQDLFGNKPTNLELSFPEKREMKYGGILEDVKNWDDIPVSWRNTKKVGRLKFEPVVTNKNFLKLIKPFLGKDELRPVFSTAHYNDTSIVATDAHKMIVLPNTTKERGNIQAIPLKLHAQTLSVGSVSDDKYPNYANVIPMIGGSVTSSYKVDCYKLMQFANTVVNYANKTTHSIKIHVTEHEYFQVNGKFLAEVLKACLELGYINVYIHYSDPEKALVLTPDKTYDVHNPKGFVILVMPNVNPPISEGMSAENIDYKFSIYVNYFLDRNEIVNHDGSVARFELNYGDETLFDPKDVKFAMSLKKQRYTLPILEGIAVDNGTMYASDLENFIAISGQQAPNGVYSFTDKMPYINPDFNLSEFPKLPETKELKASFSIQKEFFKYFISRAIKFVGNDDLRPVMQGINIKVVDGLLIACATDAHMLIRYNITPYLTSSEYTDFNVTFNPRIVKFLIEYADVATINFEVFERHVVLTADNAKLITRIEDGKFPSYEAVIPSETPKSFTVDYKEFQALLKDKDFVALKKETRKKYRDRVSSVKGFQVNATTIDIIGEVAYRESGKEEPTRKTIKLGELACTYSDEGQATKTNLVLIMPVMAEERDVIFAFNDEFVSDAISLGKGEDITFNYTAENKAYLIQGSTIDYQGKKYVIESKGFREGVGTKKNIQKRKEAINKQLAEIEKISQDGFRKIDKGQLWTVFEGFIDGEYFEVTANGNDYAPDADWTVNAISDKLDFDKDVYPWIMDESKHEDDKVYQDWINTLKSESEVEHLTKRDNLDNLMKILENKYHMQGYTLKQLYDEVINMKGSRDGAIIFSEFAQRRKEAGDKKFTEEFEKTSFVENIHDKNTDESHLINERVSVKGKTYIVKRLIDESEGDKKYWAIDEANNVGTEIYESEIGTAGSGDIDQALKVLKTLQKHNPEDESIQQAINVLRILKKNQS